MHLDITMEKKHQPTRTFGCGTMQEVYENICAALQTFNGMMKK